ncbi:MAG TPA: hypothetical protein VF170_13130 [Planctomycetaceae bacterium]
MDVSGQRPDPPSGPSRPPELSPVRPADEADPLRARRLAEIRAMIADGTYETTERLEAAVGRFLSAVDERI